MPQTRKPIYTHWYHVVRVLLITLVLCVSACTGPGHSTSVPSAHSREGGRAGPKLSGNGNGRSGM
jgi:hypothetical protein